MARSLRQPARWSKKTDELMHYVALGCRPGLQSELGRWLDESPRFNAFVTAHRDKVRKKLSTSDEETRLDVRSELLVVYLLLRDRRFDVAFEAYGARQVGPDLSVTYRTNQRFNIEVTRLRGASAEPGAVRLGNVIAGKLRQLPADVPNALLIRTRGVIGDESLVAALRLLKLHTDTKDDAFFTARGFPNARAFYALYLHLGGVFAISESDVASVTYIENREARHVLPAETARRLVACLAAESSA